MPSCGVQALYFSVGVEVCVNFRPKNSRRNVTVEKEVVQGDTAKDNDAPNFVFPLGTLDYVTKLFEGVVWRKNVAQLKLLFNFADANRIDATTFIFSHCTSNHCFYTFNFNT